MADLVKIKSNIQKMIAQNAPEADIDAYVAGEGVTPEMLRADKSPVASGHILPLSRGVDGSVSFDSNAGILGSIKSGLGLAGDVMGGKAKLPSSGDVPGSVPFGDPESAGMRVPDMAGLAAPVNPMVRAGDRAIPGVAMGFRGPAKVATPTAAELKAAGVTDIEAAKNSGLEVTASSVADYSRKVQQELFESGIHPVDAPATFAKLKELESAPEGAFATVSGLQSLRGSLQNTAQNFNPQAAKDQLAASRAIKGLDQFVPSVAEKDILAGSPAATHKLSERGRGNYAAAQRSNDLSGTLDRANTGILERAEARAQAANSGRNLDNTIRSKVVSVLEKPKEISGFSDEELNALTGVYEGGPARNTARYIGNLLGGGGGIGQSGIAAVGAGGGGVVGGIPGAIIGGVAPAVAGAGAKAIANALAKRSLNKADELVRQRSPLFLERQAEAGSEAISPAYRAALIRALMMQQQPQQ